MDNNHNSTSYLDNPNEKILQTFGEKSRVIFSSTSEIYNAVFDNATHATYIGTGDGRILKYNSQLCKLFGFSDEEMQEVHAAEMFAINDKVFIDFLKERSEKGIASAEITCIKHSGEKFPCKISSVSFQSNKGENRSMNTVVSLEFSV